MRLKFDYVLRLNISDSTYAFTFKLGMTVDAWMTYMLILVLMTLTLMQGHSVSEHAKHQRACSRKLRKQAGRGFFFTWP